MLLVAAAEYIYIYIYIYIFGILSVFMCNRFFIIDNFEIIYTKNIIHTIYTKYYTINNYGMVSL